LSAADLIPVFSWLALRGHCRYCGKKIDDTPLVEVAMPLMFVMSYLWWPQPLQVQGQGIYDLVLWLILLVCLLILMVYDFKWMLLPDKVVFPVIGLSVLYVAGNVIVYNAAWGYLINAVLAVVMVSGLFAVLHFASGGRWIGFGDVKLAIALGLLAGTPANAMLLLFVASLAGTLVALPLVIAGKAGRKTKLPFGPLLIFGTFVVVLFGERILAWYTSLFWQG
jgi:prepilin signal peptidase PulO-like enzyme (type II secretory pathway)